MSAKKIILITTFSIGVIYSVIALIASRLTYKFLGFENLLNSISNQQAVEFNMEIENPTLMTLTIRDLKVRVVSAEGKDVLSFIPVDLVARAGVKNYIKMTFEKGNAMGILGDYLNKSYKSYKVIVKGRAFGVFPIYYKTNLVTD